MLLDFFPKIVDPREQMRLKDFEAVPTSFKGRLVIAFVHGLKLKACQVLQKLELAGYVVFRNDSRLGRHERVGAIIA